MCDKLTSLEVKTAGRLQHDELTGKILRACFDTINELGAGFVESVYERAVLVVLEQYGLRARAQAPLKVMFRRVVVGEFYADLLVEDKIVVELKAVKALLPEHKAQVINYLKGSGLEVGLLVNFGHQKLEYHRLYRPIAREGLSLDEQDVQDSKDGVGGDA